MDRVNIFSGNSFKATLYGTFAFLLILVLTGVIAHRHVQTELMADLQSQITSTAAVFVEDYQHEGTEALIELVDRLAPQFERTHHLLAVFDKNGWNLAGESSLHPDFDGWAIRDIVAGMDSADVHRHYFLALPLDDVTLVIGRDLQFVENTQRALIRSLFIIGAVMTVVFITIGYQMSRRMQDKLEVMGDTLDQVANGDTAVRLPISSNNDQVDRVSKTMNLHLNRLSDLMITTKSSAAAIAHDLKRPLTRTSLSLSEVLDRNDLTDATRDSLEQTQQELNGLTAIFETILRIARIDAGKGAGLTDTVNLTDVLADMAETFSVVAEESGQTLIADFDPDAAISVKGDVGMLGQMVANLLQNAVTHCPKGAQITLSLGENADGVALSVSDTGPGIPEAIRQKVLTPFFRADHSRTTEGSGLGLALVNSIAQRHGAALTLSENKPGLKITVQFPITG